MTSKEALDRIKRSHRIAMACLLIDKPDIETEEAIKIIEKELKVLEMLKKKMSIGTDYYDSDDGCEKCEFITYNGEALNIDTEEDLKKLKEWLGND